MNIYIHGFQDGDKWRRVGRVYTSREVAETWTGFIGSYYPDRHVELREVPVAVCNGKITRECADWLADTYGIDVSPQSVEAAR